ncbi:MAG: hypothetical protein M1541_22400, partial [Acidobacteria bacterium]|nr:hypothetical protein [Acidobacteriota bacterium]
MTYESVVRVQSRSAAGVEFTVRRMSFARRMELMRAVRGLAEKVEFLEAASGASEKMDAALIWGEIDRLYVRWGLVEVTGLEIDGAPATPESLTPTSKL